MNRTAKPYTSTRGICVFPCRHEVKEVMTCFGHGLKISQVDICLEDTFLVGKAVIPTVVCLWQPTEVVTLSQNL